MVLLFDKKPCFHRKEMREYMRGLQKISPIKGKPPIRTDPNPKEQHQTSNY